MPAYNRQLLQTLIDRYPTDTELQFVLNTNLIQFDRWNVLIQDVDFIHQRMLDDMDENENTRVGSAAWQMTRPVAMEIYNAEYRAYVREDQSDLRFALGENLDIIGNEEGVWREPATNALRIWRVIGHDGVPVDMPVGSRFYVPDTSPLLTFIVIPDFPPLGDGRVVVRCETAGTIGNTYFGEVAPFTGSFAISELKEGAFVSGRDKEEDGEFAEGIYPIGTAYRARIFETKRRVPFGGNIDDYLRYLSNIDGIGFSHVYPRLETDENVNISLLDNSLQPVTPEFIETVYSILEYVGREGLGHGTVPINHKISLMTPMYESIDVELTVVLQSGFTLGQVQAQIKAEISKFFETLRTSFVADKWTTDEFTYTITPAQIINFGMNVAGVIDIPHNQVLINGNNANFTIISNRMEQFIPRLENIVINE